MALLCGVLESLNQVKNARYFRFRLLVAQTGALTTPSFWLRGNS